MTASIPRILAFVFSCLALSSMAQVPNNYVTQQEDLPCLNKRFSLRVHTTLDPQGNVTFDTVVFAAMLELTNNSFAPICVSFEICEYLEIDNYRYTSHENRDENERMVIYGDQNRIDLFIPNIDSTASCGNTPVGNVLRPDSSYAILNSQCIRDGSKWLTHELGHFFGLYNTYEAGFGRELVSGDNCETAGDLVCDTPADPFVENVLIEYVSPDNPCLFTYQPRDPQTNYYVAHTANAMSIYSSDCVCGFTRGQLERVANLYLESPYSFW